MKRSGRSRSSRSIAVHLGRVSVVVGLLLAIPKPVRLSNIDPGQPPPVQESVLGSLVLDDAKDSIRVADDAGDDAMWPVLDGSGKVVGRVARTLPAGVDVVGYRGPTEAAIVIDADGLIVGVDLVESADTEEHVTAVRDDADFFAQFVGWNWDEAAAERTIDGVSGATLTSLALAEGVIRRMGGPRTSLIFPDAITDAENQAWKADRDDWRLIRTGSFTDDTIGYQGPSEVLMRVAPDGRVDRIGLRSSLDNEPYVDYVRTERGFWALFENKTLAELAVMDLQAEGVEGVSGATMTSMAVAETIVVAARQRQVQMASAEQSAPTGPLIRFGPADIASVGLIVALAWISHQGWFRKRWLRRLWLIAVVVVIGLWSGNLVSLALVAGWSAEGVAWRLAPGLAAIAAVSLLWPPISKGNPYCNHLCPHGALQQFIKPGNKSRRHVRLPAWITKSMMYVPGLTLAVAYLCLLVVPSTDLSSWEPFHAYLFRIAGWSSLGLAAATLLASCFVPMAYCRLGCPTGYLIDYLRRRANSHRVTWPDGVALGLLATALGARLLA